MRMISTIIFNNVCKVRTAILWHHFASLMAEHYFTLNPVLRNSFYVLTNFTAVKVFSSSEWATYFDSKQ